MNSDHPTVIAHKASLLNGASGASAASKSPALTQADLIEILHKAGASDARAVSIEHPALGAERRAALEALPGARTLVSYCVRMAREPIRSPARSVANNEFHHTGHEVDDVGRKVMRLLDERGLRSLAVPMGFPMEMSEFPGRLWLIAHKTVAVAAGLGAMGIHRNVIHPRFGNFILLGTLVLETEVQAEGEPIDFNPCLECKLCVAACPVGAIGAEGQFNFSSCYNHNYREFMGGFTDWVEEVADSGSAREYRKRVPDSESTSMWQSLSFGANYKAAYCLSVCPAGEEVIGPFLADRGSFQRRHLKPLQEKIETLYVAPGSDAEAHARKRHPHKPLRHVGRTLRPSSIEQFAGGMPVVFQPGAAGDLDATYHFRFSGEEERELTVTIASGRVRVQEGMVGSADLLVRADSATWVRFLRGDISIVRALLTRRVRLEGPARLLIAFGRCFV